MSGETLTRGETIKTLNCKFCLWKYISQNLEQDKYLVNRPFLVAGISKDNTQEAKNEQLATK